MIVVVDYGMGNLFSVAKALEQLGEEVVISNKEEDIKRAEKIVLPGVGSFAEGMKNLKKLSLITVLKKEILENKKPFLGICLGMQLLAITGEEDGLNEGFGWIPFKVEKFKFNSDNQNNALRIPHMGWDNLILKESPLFKGINPENNFYFVHSYHLVPLSKKEGEDLIAAECHYGYNFPAAIQKENIFATQFHPEKSQQAGLKILKNFVEWKSDN